MISQVLRDARKYEETAEQTISGEERPAFHLSPRVGWMNDPNGFSYYQGKYHLFYQYHPYDTHWGPMYWGHGVSSDLLHWEYFPAAMAPDMPYDNFGCFSGSALEMEDGRQLLMYTGVVKEVQPDGALGEIQTQCVAVGDGTDYEKYEENPVLDFSDLPEGGSKFDFRDPKIWKTEDGSFRCVAANCDQEHDGRILLFGSKDGFHWRYRSTLAVNNGRFGRMWECPDFFPLDGKQLLMVSPQDMLPCEFEYHNGNGTVCLIGSYDSETEVFTEERDQAIDYGIDFYAPQTILTPDGRRVMIGWMQNWDTCNLRSVRHPWFGQMTVPRELSVVEGRLIQQPIRELEMLRRDKTEYHDVIFSDFIQLEGIRGRKIDLEVSISPADEKNMYRKFAVRFAQDGDHHTSVGFRPQEGTVKIDRRFSGSRRAAIHQRRCQVPGLAGRIKMRIILDRFSAEVFINDGIRVLSMTLYTPQTAEEISFYGEGMVKMDVVKYSLED